MRVSILACAALLAMTAAPVAVMAATAAPTKTAKPALKVIRGQHTKYMWQGVAAHPTGGGAATHAKGSGGAARQGFEVGYSSHDQRARATHPLPARRAAVTPTKGAGSGGKFIMGQHTGFMWQGVAAHPTATGGAGRQGFEVGYSSHDQRGPTTQPLPARKAAPAKAASAKTGAAGKHP